MEKQLLKEYESLIQGEEIISVYANTSAFLNEHLNNINWVGFYLMKNNELILGPFQGKIACYRIPLGKGVCGTAAFQKETLRISNVHEFKGHIACDSASNSEIVIPMIINDKVIGVLDIDSPLLNRFSEEDQNFLQEIVKILVKEINR